MINRIKFFGLVTMAAFLMMTAPASAVLIDNGTTTIDTDTGLEWLDLTESTGFSFAAASAEFGVGGAFEGYRHATEADINTFTTNAGFPPFFQTPFNDPAFAAFLGVIGITNDLSPDELQSRGYFDNGGLPGTVGFADMGALFFFEEDFIFILPDSFTDTSSATIGNFLVRTAEETVTIAEPGTMALFGLGFAGMMLARRRKLN